TVIPQAANSFTNNGSTSSSYGLYSTGHLTMRGQGSGSFEAEGAAAQHKSVGIYIEDGDLFVEGSGISVSGRGGDSDVNAGIWCFDGDVTVESGCSLEGTCASATTSNGLVVYGKLTVKGGTVYGKGGDANSSLSSSRGISTGSVKSTSANTSISGIAGSSTESTGIILWNSSSFAAGQMDAYAPTGQSENSYGIMPASGLTVSGGTVTAQGGTAAYTVAPAIADGFAAAVWYGQNKDAADAAGEQPASDIAACYTQKYVHIETVPVYEITLQPSGEGTVNADKTQAKKGDVIHFAAAANAGYQVQEVTVYDREGTVYASFTVAEGTFVMPGCSVSIAAMFTPANNPDDNPSGDQPGSNPGGGEPGIPAPPEGDPSGDGPTEGPDTGDNSRPGLWLSMMLLAAIGMAASAIILKKQRAT
ncbi:MAG: hypothetical protein IJP03_02485, partial [Christensenellaceae bacterium]|nr:hypothetical protein [Christensenellaceae bacterium]